MKIRKFFKSIKAIIRLYNNEAIKGQEKGKSWYI